jgi:hypothetical protein
VELKIGPFLFSITWHRPQPPVVDRAAELTDFASEMLDTAALLQPVALELLGMNLPEESQVFLQVVVNPHHLLACRPDDALRAIRHVAYLAVESGLASYSSINRL